MTRSQKPSPDVHNAEKPGRPTATARPASLWQHRDFLLLWSGQMVSAIGSQVSTLAFPWLILAVTGSPLQAVLIAAIRTLPYLLFAPPTGALVARRNRQPV